MTTPTKRDVEKRLDDLDEDRDEKSVAIAYKDPETGDLYRDKSLEVPYDPPEGSTSIVLRPDFNAPPSDWES